MNENLFKYNIFGFKVLSEIDLPGSPAFQFESIEADVQIVVGGVPDRLPDFLAEGPNWQHGVGRFLLHVPKVTRFLIEGGKIIVVDPVGRGAVSDCTPFLLGPAFGVLLLQRRRLALRASAIEVGGGVIAIAGRSGTGKSTLAAYLSQLGYPLVADDVLAVSIGLNGEAVPHPDGGVLQLWTGSVRHLRFSDGVIAPVRSGSGKHYVCPAVRSERNEPLRLLAVACLVDPHVLDEDGGGDGQLAEPLSIPNQALMLEQSRYLPVIERLLVNDVPRLQASALLMRSATVHLIPRGDDLSELPKLADTILTLEHPSCRAILPRVR